MEIKVLDSPCRVPKMFLNSKNRYKWVLYLPQNDGIIKSQHEAGVVDCANVEDAHSCVDIVLDLHEWDEDWIFDDFVGGWIRYKNEEDECPHVIIYEKPGGRN